MSERRNDRSRTRVLRHNRTTPRSAIRPNRARPNRRGSWVRCSSAPHRSSRCSRCTRCLCSSSSSRGRVLCSHRSSSRRHTRSRTACSAADTSRHCCTPRCWDTDPSRCRYARTRVSTPAWCNGCRRRNRRRRCTRSCRARRRKPLEARSGETGSPRSRTSFDTACRDGRWSTWRLRRYRALHPRERRCRCPRTPAHRRRSRKHSGALSSRLPGPRAQPAIAIVDSSGASALRSSSSGPRSRTDRSERRRSGADVYQNTRRRAIVRSALLRVRVGRSRRGNVLRIPTVGRRFFLAALARSLSRCSQRRSGAETMRSP